MSSATIRIALAQLDAVVGDLAANVRAMLDAAERARERGVQLVVYPELSVCGYPPRDLVERPAFAAACERALDRLARWTAQPGAPTLVFGTLDWPVDSTRPRNLAVIAQAGEVRRVVKQLLPTYDVFDEARHFAAGAAGQPAIFEVGGARIGVLICEDQWTDPRLWGGLRMYGADPTAELAARGAQLILNLSASPFNTGKLGLRVALCGATASEHGVAVALVNSVGGNDSLIFDGGSLLVDPDGGVVGLGPRFGEGLLWADFEPLGRRFFAVSPPEAARAKGVAGSWRPPVACQVPLDDGQLEEIASALVLGVRSYATKLGFGGLLLGLSGGIDSALVAWIAAEALGGQAVLAVEMPSRFTAPLSRSIAADLIANLGLRACELPIEPIQASFLHTLAPSFRGAPEDVTEENLQARIRGTLLMALSNKFGPLLLSTGNKSEMAVGYCTLYGDMNGGLSVISDVYKLQVYALARWINRRDGRATIPREVIERAPSAELRADQTDQDSLPPYELLDPVLVGMLEDRLEDREIFERVRASHPQLDLATVGKIRGLIDRAEFKRHQAAPTLRVSRKAWHGRRYPIVQRFRPLAGELDPAADRAPTD